MFDRIRRWYDGTPKTVQFDNDPNSGVYFMPYFYNEQHWTARLAHVCVDFYLEHWQWIWSTVIGAGALYVSVLALR